MTQKITLIISLFICSIMNLNFILIEKKIIKMHTISYIKCCRKSMKKNVDTKSDKYEINKLKKILKLSIDCQNFLDKLHCLKKMLNLRIFFFRISQKPHLS